MSLQYHTGANEANLPEQERSKTLLCQSGVETSSVGRWAHLQGKHLYMYKQ